MNSTLKVNVLITTFNHSKYIEDTLIGVLNQRTNFEYNIIVHDDASTDETQLILRKYKLKYPDKIILVLQPVNLFSKGIDRYPYIKQYLVAQYIARCEGDDYWIDYDKLQKQFDFLESNKDFYAVYHNVLTVDEHHCLSHNQNYRIIPAREYTLNQTIKGSLPGQTASMFSRNFYIAKNHSLISSFNTIRVNGDVRLANLFTVLGRVYRMSDIMAVHRKVYSSGDSYTARTYGKNLTLKRYVGYLDLEKVGKKFSNGKYTNKVSRRLVVSKIALNRFLKPTNENKRIYKEFKLVKEDSILLSLATYFTMLPKRLVGRTIRNFISY